MIGSLVGRITDVLDRRRDSARAASPARRRVTLLVAFAVFVVAGTVAALRVRDDPRAHFHGGWTLVLVLSGPALLYATSLEYRAIARLLGHRVPTLAAMRVSVLSSAANVLPIPGSVLVRMNDLRGRGSGYREIARAVALTGLLGLATAGVASGGFTLFRNVPLGATILAGGLACVGVAIALARAMPSADGARLVYVVGAELAIASVTGARLWVAFAALGYTISLPQAAAITVASFAASATAVFPAGLGVRELLTGAIGAAVSLPVAVGVLATALDRIAFFVVLGLGALAFAVAGERVAR